MRSRDKTGYATADTGVLAASARAGKARKAACFDALGIEPGRRVLDLGCGPGHDLVEIARRVGPTGLAVGLDAFGEFARAARQRCHACGADANVAAGEATRLPFRTAAFDCCNIERVLQHVIDPAAVLAEVARVVSRGGLVGITEPDRRLTLADGPDQDTWQRIIAATVAGTGRHPNIGAAVPTLLARAGFEILDIQLHARGIYRDLRSADEAYLISGLAQEAERLGAIPAGRAASWLEECEAAAARGEFLVLSGLLTTIASRVTDAV
ncbi:MAG: methyltransferase domain-containing protein [Chloroflexi bacterium]|nr:methyltransferase domain-containing protein [Chloroflexota bacterium]